MIKTLIPILSLAAAVGLYFVHIDPSLANIKILKERESEFSEALEKARQLEEFKERLSTQLLSFEEEELEALDKFLPKAVDNVRLIFDVNSIAEQYGTKLISAEAVEIAATQSEESYTTVDLRFSVDMEYKIFLAFIADLEQSLRLIDVSSIRFSTGNVTGADTGSGTIDVTFNTYSSN